jgi:hypothetical protein
MPHPSLADPAARDAAIARLHRFRPDAVRRWGEMESVQVMPHLADAIRRALGRIPAGPMPRRLRAFVLRSLFVHHLPWPKEKIKSSPGAFSTTATTWEGDQQLLIDLIQEFSATPNEGLAPYHPAFGPMTPHDWGVLMYRHVDHHLRQFGS